MRKPADTVTNKKIILLFASSPSPPPMKDNDLTKSEQALFPTFERQLKIKTNSKEFKEIFKNSTEYEFISNLELPSSMKAEVKAKEGTPTQFLQLLKYLREHEQSIWMLNFLCHGTKEGLYFTYGGTGDSSELTLRTTNRKNDKDWVYVSYLWIDHEIKKQHFTESMSVLLITACFGKDGGLELIAGDQAVSDWIITTTDKVDYEIAVNISKAFYKLIAAEKKDVIELFNIANQNHGKDNNKLIPLPGKIRLKVALPSLSLPLSPLPSNYFDATVTLEENFSWFSEWSKQNNNIIELIEINVQKSPQVLNKGFPDDHALDDDNNAEIEKLYEIINREEIDHSLILYHIIDFEFAHRVGNAICNKFIGTNCNVFYLDSKNSINILNGQLENLIECFIGENIKVQRNINSIISAYHLQNGSHAESSQIIQHCEDLFSILHKLNYLSKLKQKWIFYINRFPGNAETIKRILLKFYSFRFIINTVEEINLNEDKRNDKILMHDFTTKKYESCCKKRLGAEVVAIDDIEQLLDQAFQKLDNNLKCLLIVFAYTNNIFIPSSILPDKLGAKIEELTIGILIPVVNVTVNGKQITLIEFNETYKKAIQKFSTPALITQGFHIIISTLGNYVDNKWVKSFLRSIQFILIQKSQGVDKNEYKMISKAFFNVCINIYKITGDVSAFMEIYKTMSLDDSLTKQEGLQLYMDYLFMSTCYNLFYVNDHRIDFSSVLLKYNTIDDNELTLTVKDRFNLYRLVNSDDTHASEMKDKIVTFDIKLQNLNSKISDIVRFDSNDFNSSSDIQINYYELCKKKYYLVYEKMFTDKFKKKYKNTKYIDLYKDILNTIGSAINYFDTKNIIILESIQLYFELLTAICYRELSQCYFGLERVNLLSKSSEIYCKLLNECLQQHGKFDRLTAAILDNLALLRCYEGKIVQAHALITEALIIHQQILPKENFKTDTRVALVRLIQFKVMNLEYNKSRIVEEDGWKSEDINGGDEAERVGNFEKINNIAQDLILRFSNNKILDGFHLMFKVEYSNYIAKKLALTFKGGASEVQIQVNRLMKITGNTENTICYVFIEKAIALNNPIFAKALIENDNDLLYYRDDNQLTLLHKAVNYNYAEMVELLLYCMSNQKQPQEWKKPNINMSDDGNYLPLEFDEKIHYMINAVDSDGCNALHIAAYMGYLQITAMLVSDRNILFFKDNAGYTPQLYAVELQYTDLVQFLVTSKSIKVKGEPKDINIRKKEDLIKERVQNVLSKRSIQTSELVYAIFDTIQYNLSGLTNRLLKVVLQKNFRVVYLDEYSFELTNTSQNYELKHTLSILEYLAMMNKYELLSEILTEYKKYKTKLQISVWEEYFSKNLSALYRAAGSYSSECMYIFLRFIQEELKMNILALRGQDSWTLFHEAMTSGQYRKALIKLLVEQFPQSLILQDDNGEPPIMLAMRIRNNEYYEVMLDESDQSDLFLTNIDGITAHIYITTQKPYTKHVRLDTSKVFNFNQRINLYDYEIFMSKLVSYKDLAAKVYIFFKELIFKDNDIQIRKHKHYVSKKIKYFENFGKGNGKSGYEYKLIDDLIIDSITNRRNKMNSPKSTLDSIETMLILIQGFSGSGKTTLLERIAIKLFLSGYPVCLLTVYKRKVRIFNTEVEPLKKFIGDKIFINSAFIESVSETLANFDQRFNKDDPYILLIDNQSGLYLELESHTKGHIAIVITSSIHQSMQLFDFDRVITLEPFSQDEIILYLWNRLAQQKISRYTMLKDYLLNNKNAFLLLSSPLSLSIICDYCELNNIQFDAFIAKIQLHSHEIYAVEYLIFDNINLNQNEADPIKHPRYSSFVQAKALSEYKTIEEIGIAINNELDTAAIRFYYIYLSCFCEHSKVIIEILKTLLVNADPGENKFTNILRILHLLGMAVQLGDPKMPRELRIEEIEMGTFFKLNTHKYPIPRLPHNSQFIEPVYNDNKMPIDSPLLVIHKFLEFQAAGSMHKILDVDNNKNIITYTDTHNRILTKDILLGNPQTLFDKKHIHQNIFFIKVIVNNEDYALILYSRNAICYRYADSKVVRHLTFKDGIYFSIVFADVFTKVVKEQNSNKEQEIKCLVVIDRDGQIYIADINKLPELKIEESSSISIPFRKKIISVTKIYSDKVDRDITMLVYLRGEVRYVKISFRNDFSVNIKYNEPLNGISLPLGSYSPIGVLNIPGEKEETIAYISTDYSLNTLKLRGKKTAIKPLFFGNDRVANIFVTAAQNLIVYGDSNRLYLVSLATSPDYYKIIYVNIHNINKIIESNLNAQEMLMISSGYTHTLLPMPAYSLDRQLDIDIGDYNASTIFENKGEKSIAIVSKSKISLFNLVTRSLKEYNIPIQKLILFIRCIVTNNKVRAILIDNAECIWYMCFDEGRILNYTKPLIYEGIPFRISKYRNEVYLDTIKSNDKGQLQYRNYPIDSARNDGHIQFGIDKSSVRNEEITAASNDIDVLYPQLIMHGNKMYDSLTNNIPLDVQINLSDAIFKISQDVDSVAILDKSFLLTIVDLYRNSIQNKSNTIGRVNLQNKLPNMIFNGDINNIKCFIFKNKKIALGINNDIYFFDPTVTVLNLKSIRVGEHANLVRLYFIEEAEDKLSIVSINRFSHIIHWQYTMLNSETKWAPVYSSYPTFSYISDNIPAQNLNRLDFYSIRKRYFCMVIKKSESIYEYFSGNKNSQLKYYADSHPVCFQLTFTTYDKLDDAKDALSAIVARHFGLTKYRLQQLYLLLNKNPDIKAYIVLTYYNNNVLFNKAKTNNFNQIMFCTIDLRYYLHMEYYKYEKLSIYDLTYIYACNTKNRVNTVISTSRHEEVKMIIGIPEVLYNYIARSGKILFPVFILNQYGQNVDINQYIIYDISGVEYVFVEREQNNSCSNFSRNIVNSELTLPLFKLLVDQSYNPMYIECLLGFLFYIIVNKNSKVHPDAVDELCQFIIDNLSNARNIFDKTIINSIIISYFRIKSRDINYFQESELLKKLNDFESENSEMQYSHVLEVILDALPSEITDQMSVRSFKDLRFVFVLCRELSNRGMSELSVRVFFSIINKSIILKLKDSELEPSIALTIILSLATLFKQLHLIKLAFSMINFHHEFFSSAIAETRNHFATNQTYQRKIFKLELYDTLLSIANYSESFATKVNGFEISPIPIVELCYLGLRKKVAFMKSLNPQKYAYQLSHLCNFLLIFYVSDKTLRLNNLVVLSLTIHKRLVDDYHRIMKVVLSPNNILTRESIGGALSYAYFLTYIHRYDEASRIANYILASIRELKNSPSADQILIFRTQELESGTLYCLTSILSNLSKNANSTSNETFSAIKDLLAEYIEFIRSSFNEHLALFKHFINDDSMFNIDESDQEITIIKFFKFAAKLYAYAAGSNLPFVITLNKLVILLEDCKNKGGIFSFGEADQKNRDDFIKRQMDANNLKSILVNSSQSIHSDHLKRREIKKKWSNRQLGKLADGRDRIPEASHHTTQSDILCDTNIKLASNNESRSAFFIDTLCPKSESNKSLNDDDKAKHLQALNVEDIKYVLLNIANSNRNRILKKYNRRIYICLLDQNDQNSVESLNRFLSEQKFTGSLLLLTNINNSVEAPHYILIVIHDGLILIDPEGKFDTRHISLLNKFFRKQLQADYSLIVSTLSMQDDKCLNVVDASDVICLALCEFFLINENYTHLKEITTVANKQPLSIEGLSVKYFNVDLSKKIDNFYLPKVDDYLNSVIRYHVKCVKILASRKSELIISSKKKLHGSSLSGDYKDIFATLSPRPLNDKHTPKTFFAPKYDYQMGVDENDQLYSPYGFWNESAAVSQGFDTYRIGSPIQCGDATYIRHPVDPDGDCGYTAFGILRQQAYQFLIENIRAIRDILKPVLIEALLTNKEFINILKNDDFGTVKNDAAKYYEAILRNDRDLDAFEANLKMHANDLDLMLYYINYDVIEKKIDDGWCHPLILYALAEIRGIDLCFYEIEDEKMITHRHYPGYHPYNATNTVELLFIGGNHFEKVEKSLGLEFGQSEHK